ncbi:BAHD acyltransferase DCR-like [Durio zibethinus]|uniref:BAHD acyltransferase DCR-like n=1 Tax=Durio zibethinus TaxID=66656 RepID=A0A6P6ASC3_DURZI|nr:BAHD acyltransferase DCR-like [Durio zibethinus]
MPSSSVTLISKCTIFPDQKSDIKSLKLSVSDIPMLSCQYIQKGVLLTSPPFSFDDLVVFLKQSLSTTLSYFPPLAGRLTTDPDGHLHITCNDAGIHFLVVKSPKLSIHDILFPGDVPDCVKEFFTFDKTISYSGHFKPLAAVQVTELVDGVFIGCTVNHAVTDGTSFWHFFNTFAEISKGASKISKSPHFCRNTVFNSQAVLKFPPGGPTVTFAGDKPLRERIFHFSREAILKLKYRANYGCLLTKQMNSEVLGKLCNDSWKSVNGETNGTLRNSNDEISSFQSLCAQLWRSVTRARKLEPTKITTFRMAVNCRHRLDPKLEQYYFGNAIQSIPTFVPVGELLAKDLSWGADLLHKNVVAHEDDTVRRGVADWEKQPRLFPLGNFDGASLTMGSSPRFPMYNNDFGWGRPLAVRSGRANKFDGKISAFPGREGNGSVDLEIVLAPDTMAGLECDGEIMQYVSEIV